MKISPTPSPSALAWRSRAAGFMLGVVAAISALPATSVEIDQAPLQAVISVPGNLALIPSVEFPTILSQANLNAYDGGKTYTGYFDANKCYGYNYSTIEAERHFFPVGPAVARACADNTTWSGNYMNWAATQTIDPFRLALTGGNRVVDTPTVTILQKARYDRDSGNYFPNRDVGAVAALAASPVNGTFGDLRTRINNLGHQMYFARSALGNTLLNNPGTAKVDYDPSKHPLSGKILVGASLVDDPNVYAVSVRVKVCVAGMLESNCKQYSEGAKPEGLIQQYSTRMRFSIFGFLNDSSMLRDGGVLRANQKFVGPFNYPPAQSPVANAASEWDATTGVLVANPDAAAASATNADMGISSIASSGVINYLNKFGEMTTKNHKDFDPVSELYYTAVRYFKGLPPVPEYSAVTGTGLQKFELADGFPVVTSWEDPIQYKCQANVALGIGDVYTHRDKNLPSASGTTSATDEPSKPSLVSSDTTVDVITATAKVGQLESVALNETGEFSGRQNSAYIAGLAYDAHTRDMRPDDATKAATSGKQTLTTHWVDVRENQTLEGRARNQYLLAAKYGGFEVPEGYDPYARTTPLPDGWWWNSGETLATGDKRPDNFYVASEADKMVASLTSAFRKILNDIAGSGGSFAANTTRLEIGATTYQAQYRSGSWTGELSAYAVDQTTGKLALTPTWEANDKFPAWATRKIRFVDTGVMKNFTYTNLNAAQKLLLESESIVDYLRGDRSKEDASAKAGDTSGKLRARQGLLGDIVNSQPVYVGKPNDRQYVGSTFTGAASYGAFVTAQAARAPVVYVGANDGMLHGFNATTGVETFALVPSAAMTNLAAYAKPGYDHRYYVDGELTVADVYYGGSWKTVLVGTLGRGGRSMFALDVTNPADVKFLWEKTAIDIPALGNNLGKPIIAQVADGNWQVLLGNGPNSTGGKAQLVMVNVSTGVVKTVDTGAASDNGMSGVQAWDADKNGFSDTVYAGDFKGNLWKLSALSGTTTVLKLFTTTDGTNAQPITAAPLVGRRPGSSETWVFFGTGQFLSSADLSNKQVQSWYGLIDAGATISGRADLVQRTIVAEVTTPPFDIRVVSEGAESDLVGKKGWYMDLRSPVRGAEGERMVLPNLFQGLVLIGATRIPEATDVCKPTGRGFIMAIDPFTGARLGSGFFDANEDGVIDDKDSVKLSDGTVVPGSGIGFKDSAPNNPVFIGDVMQVSLDDSKKKSLKTYSGALSVRRVSWRELLGD